MLLHYFQTGLKPVSIDGPLPMSVDEFLGRAEQCLSEHIVVDLKQLMAIKQGDFHHLKNHCRSALVRAFADQAMQLYGVVSCEIMKKHGLMRQTIDEELAAFFCDNEQIAEIDQDRFSTSNNRAFWALDKAVNNPDPLVLERALMVALFLFIDERAPTDPFAVDHVFVYFIKLLLCERWRSFDEQAGQKVFLQLVNQVMHGI